jgi:hypothetical protein
MNAINILSKEVSGLPSMCTAWDRGVSIGVGVTVVTNRLSEQRECGEELGNAVMTHNPFTRTN